MEVPWDCRINPVNFCHILIKQCLNILCCNVKILHLKFIQILFLGALSWHRSGLISNDNDDSFECCEWNYKAQIFMSPSSGGKNIREFKFSLSSHNFRCLKFLVPSFIMEWHARSIRGCKKICHKKKVENLVYEQISS